MIRFSKGFIKGVWWAFNGLDENGEDPFKAVENIADPVARQMISRLVAELRRQVNVVIKVMEWAALATMCGLLCFKVALGAEPDAKTGGTLPLPGQTMPGLSCSELAKSVITNRQAAAWPLIGPGPNGLVPVSVRAEAVRLAAQLAAVDLELARTICSPLEFQSALRTAAEGTK